MDIDEIIKRLSNYKKVKKKQDIAKLIGLSPSDYSNRYGRGTLLPVILISIHTVSLIYLLKLLLSLLLITGVSIGMIFEGKLPKRPLYPFLAGIIRHTQNLVRKASTLWPACWSWPAWWDWGECFSLSVFGNCADGWWCLWSMILTSNCSQLETTYLVFYIIIYSFILSIGLPYH